MVTLNKGEYLGDIRYRHAFDGLMVIDTVYHQPVYPGWHSHEQAHLTLVLNGGNRETRQKTEHQLGCGRLVFYRTKELHRNDHTLFPSRNINIEIDADFLSRSGVGEEDLERAVAAHRLAAADVICIMKEVSQHRDHAAESISMILAGAMAKHISRHPPAWVMRVRDMLQDEWAGQPSLSDLSAAAGVHATTVSKYFTSYFGCTLSVYLRRLKVERAIPMVREGRYSLSGIAYICGFSDQSHFIRTFKAETGYLPNAFRRY